MICEVLWQMIYKYTQCLCTNLHSGINCFCYVLNIVNIDKLDKALLQLISTDDQLLYAV